MMRTAMGEASARPKYATRFSIRLEDRCALILLVATAGQPGRSDEFDRLEGASLFDIPGRAGTRIAAVLNYRELEALPPVLSDQRAAFVIVKTDQGNPSPSYC